MASIEVRRATEPDMEPLLDLWVEMMDYHTRLDPRFERADDGRERFRGVVQTWMADDTFRVLVATAGGVVVGYSIGRVQENPVLKVSRWAFVSDICIAPAWRRQGVGRRLYEALRQWFSSQGLTHVRLNVSAANPVSQAFWQAVGFQTQFLHLSSEIQYTNNTNEDEGHEDGSGR